MSGADETRLFVVDGCISMPIALLGYIILPDLPHNCRAFYLTPEERAFGQKRMQLEGRKEKAPFTKAKFKKIFSSWHLYLVSAESTRACFGCELR
jgi:ACS family pantothenate transporter-like MFS transporter